MLCLRISRDFPPHPPVICGKIGKTTLIGQTSPDASRTPFVLQYSHIQRTYLFRCRAVSGTVSSAQRDGFRRSACIHRKDYLK